MGRVIVVIAEGLSNSLLNKWLAQGLLPGFSSFINSGSHGVFLSHFVPYEPSALLSIFTGQSPGNTGCYSYWHAHAKTISDFPDIFLATEIQVPCIWQLPGAKKLRVGIINLFGTHPPKPLNGYIVSYPLSPTLRACYPPSFILDLSRNKISYGHDVSALYRGESKNEAAAMIQNLESERIKAFWYLFNKSLDFYILNITVIDRLSHFWWGETDDTSKIDTKDMLVFRAYQQVDSFLQRLINEIKLDDQVFIFSEIGFGDLKKYISVNEILQNAGLLKLENGYINAEKTFAAESVQGTHGINLNLARRYFNGIILEKEEESWLDRVKEVLVDAVNPQTGLPMFSKIYKSNEIYSGIRTNEAPDLIVEPYDDKFLPLGHPYWANKVHRHLQTGWHRRESHWFYLGRYLNLDNRLIDCYSMFEHICNSLNIINPNLREPEFENV